MLWAYANSVGLTADVSRATGVHIPDAVKIPGIKDATDASRALQAHRNDAARTAATKASEEARRLAERQLRDRQAQAKLRSALPEWATKSLLPAAPGPGPTAKAGPGGAWPYANPAAYAAARNQLAHLAIKGRAPLTGYTRTAFGSAWDDAAGNFAWTRNGCDTRNDVLARDLVRRTTKPGTCKVLTGDLVDDPYTGKKIHFVFGGAYANSLDTEHVVALGNTWVTGAQGWDAAKRAAVANDPMNLMMVDPSANRSKGDADFATWLPPNKPYRCAYAARQLAVKTKYGLWVTAPEKQAMDAVLATCR